MSGSGAGTELNGKPDCRGEGTSKAECGKEGWDMTVGSRLDPGVAGLERAEELPCSMSGKVSAWGTTERSGRRVWRWADRKAVGGPDEVGRAGRGGVAELEEVGGCEEDG
jgi:hypothetical protein